jgi:Zn-dependent protease
MSDDAAAAHERHVRNLQAVAEHLLNAPPPRAGAGRSRVGAALRRWGPLGLLLALLFGKTKWLLAVGKAPLSMLVMVWVYATMWGLPFAAGFVLLIFVHELGHALVMRQQGIPASAPVFIPFVGAVIAMRGLPRDAWVEALVAMGGPVLGSVGAAACLAMGVRTGDRFWYALASTGFMINLFNLIPLHPLDGGRIVGAVSRWLWVVGAVLGVAVFLATWSPMMLLLLLFGLMNAGQLLRPPTEDYYRIPAARRLAVGASYVTLAVALVLAGWWTDRTLHGPAQQMAVDAASLTLAAALRGRGRRPRAGRPPDAPFLPGRDRAESG